MRITTLTSPVYYEDTYNGSQIHCVEIQDGHQFYFEAEIIRNQRKSKHDLQAANWGVVKEARGK